MINLFSNGYLWIIMLLKVEKEGRLLFHKRHFQEDLDLMTLEHNT